MRFENWRFCETATYVTRKKSAKLHPQGAPSGFSSIAFQAAMMAQQEFEHEPPLQPEAAPVNPRSVTSQDRP